MNTLYNFNTLVYSCCFMNHQIQSCRILQRKLKGKVKGKGRPKTGNESPAGEE
jgi:hypothetical protein